MRDEAQTTGVDPENEAQFTLQIKWRVFCCLSFKLLVIRMSPRNITDLIVLYAPLYQCNVRIYRNTISRKRRAPLCISMYENV